MMQLWQWIRGRSGQAAVLGLFTLTSLVGCRSSGTLSSQSYGWPSAMGWSSAVVAAGKKVKEEIGTKKKEERQKKGKGTKSK